MFSSNSYRSAFLRTPYIIYIGSTENLVKINSDGFVAQSYPKNLQIREICFCQIGLF